MSEINTLMDELRGPGYTIRPLLDAHDVQALAQLVTTLCPPAPKDYYVTAFTDDVSIRRKVHEGVVALVREKVQRLLPGYDILLSQFVTKRARSVNGRLGLHQDYSFGDHDTHQIINLWIPLSDVDTRNACLRVLAGSQHLGHIAAIPPNPSPYDRYRAELENEFMVEKPMAAGDAFIFDPRLLHSTGENVTDQDRIALFLNLVPQGTTPLIHIWDPTVPHRLGVYAVTSDALTRIVPNEFMEHPQENGATFLSYRDCPIAETPREVIEALRPVRA